MRRICLTLPTNRECATTIAAICDEAAYAADTFDVEVHLLILDSSDEDTFTTHAETTAKAGRAPRVLVHHLGEKQQRDFLRRVIDRAGVGKPDLMLDLMLPGELSYGACTNRAFLIAVALGCESVHRRDSDSRYQQLDGVPVYPVHHELMSLGKRAADAGDGVSETALAPALVSKPVAMVGSSFVGELSVDIGDAYRRNPGAYYDVVSLWAPRDWSDEKKRQLVDESFRGAGNHAFTHDYSTLTVVDPMRVDMCNISFHQVYEEVPLPPATNTIGSDYFLIHLVHDAKLPGVLHNRNIVNYYTAERRTDTGFVAYQLRFTKFLLSMLYFNFIYRRMAEAGESLLDEQHRVRFSRIAEFARESTGLDTYENVERLNGLDHAYRELGGRYAAFAETLAPLRNRLLDEARQDIEDFALLTEAWQPLIRAGRATRLTEPLATASGMTADENRRIRAALAAASDDRIVFDLAGIQERYDSLTRDLPGISVRFAMKACPVNEVLARLAQAGAGFDAASPNEIAQALRTGVPASRVHYGNTVKSDRNIADAYRLGVRDFATDSLEDIAAIAARAPASRVFCRLAAPGDGALWGLSRKFGCSSSDAVRVLEAAQATGLTPAGLSVHVGSQQMTANAWRHAVDCIAEVLAALNRRGILLDHINFGGGLPALGYTDKEGRPLNPPMDTIFATIREGMQHLSEVSQAPLDFVMEPGRYLVADHGVIRAHVSRLSARQQLDGEREHWLYLSAGKFNGLYEMDELQYRLEFPRYHNARFVRAVVAGPTCDSDDAYARLGGLVSVPEEAASGDPVWIFSCGAYATSYMTQGFNGLDPLPYTCIDSAGTTNGSE